MQYAIAFWLLVGSIAIWQYSESFNRGWFAILMIPLWPIAVLFIEFGSFIRRVWWALTGIDNGASRHSKK